MKSATKIWLIVAAALILIGGLTFAISMQINGWDFEKISTVKYQTNSYEINEDIKSIFIEADTADINLIPSEDGKTKVLCFEDVKHSVFVEDGVLSVKHNKQQKWYRNIGIGFKQTKITIYLPENTYKKLDVITDTGDIEISRDFGFETVYVTTSTGDITNLASASDEVLITASTGDINISHLSAKKIGLVVSTGRISVSDVSCEGDFSFTVSTGKSEINKLSCERLISKGGTGDISLKEVIAKKSFEIERSTGDVIFDRCDAADIDIKTDTGDVSGSFKSEKIFFVETNTGDIDIPKSLTGGKCEITTDTGDIYITIE